MDAARADLATRTGLDPATFTTIRAEQVIWSDGSLGCPVPGYSYIQMVTPGYWIQLEAGGKTYDYRSTLSGPVRRCDLAARSRRLPGRRRRRRRPAGLVPGAGERPAPGLHSVAVDDDRDRQGVGCRRRSELELAEVILARRHCLRIGDVEDDRCPGRDRPDGHAGDGQVGALDRDDREREGRRAGHPKAVDPGLVVPVGRVRAGSRSRRRWHRPTRRRSRTARTCRRCCRRRR